MKSQFPLWLRASSARAMLATCVLVAPMRVLAQQAPQDRYYDPYLATPSRPFDYSPRPSYNGGPTPPPAERPPIWSGLTLGADFGYRWDTTAVNALALPSAGAASPRLGVHLGTNGQAGAIVFGVEGDVMFGGSSAAATSGLASLTSRDTWTSSLRLRGGIALGDALVYGTGGVAMASSTVNAGSVGAISQFSGLQFGTVLGAGLEYKFSQHVSARIEGLHYNFNGASLATVSGTSSIKQESNTVRAGLTFHFN